MATLAMAGAAAAQQVANVYRDEYGMAHIEAQQETAAWYAMGYEQGRDGLLFAQINMKVLGGTSLAHLRPINAPNAAKAEFAFADLIVSLLATRPSGTPTQLRQLFAPSPGTGITADFVDNIEAYCQGLNDYRIEVENASSGAEYDMQQWLYGSNFPWGDSKWAVTDPIDPIDVLSWGRHNKAVLMVGFAQGKLPVINTPGTGTTFTGGGAGGEASGVIPHPNESNPNEFFQRLTASLRQFPLHQGAGSNSFVWSHHYTADQNGSWSGSVADPHWTLPAAYLGPWLGQTLLWSGQPSWYGHVKVTPSGASTPTLDALGHMSYGAGTFYVSHNRDIAYGGSLGSPNPADCFLLRLKHDPVTGQPLLPYQVYSYELDTDGDDGADSGDWITLTHQDHVVGDLSTGQFTFRVWRAGRFGFVLPDRSTVPAGSSVVFNTMPVVHCEQGPWRLTPGQLRNRYYGAPQWNGSQLTTWPAVGALRIPMDAAVGGEAHHSRLGVGMWELAHADSIWDVADQLIDHDCGYITNLTAVDREGRLFAIQSGTIPVRGDDTLLQQAGYHVFPEKFLAYTGPVPARRKSDQAFDWQFLANGSLRYLAPGGSGGAGATQFHPYIVFDPTNYVCFPPMSVSSIGNELVWENPGFVNLSNEMPWMSWRHTVGVAPIPGSTAYNNVASTSPLVQAALDAGTIYASVAWAWEAQDRNQSVTDRQLQTTNWTFGFGGVPPMSIADAKTLAVESRVYAPARYQSPTTTPALPAATPPYASYPTAVRQLKEAVDNLGHVESPKSIAAAEEKFFADLWSMLWQPPAGSDWASYTIPGGGPTVNLKDLWVDNDGTPGNPRQVFWFTSTGSTPSVTWFEMPDDYALIDFLWNQSGLDAGNNGAPFRLVGAVTPSDGGLSSSDVTSLTNAVGTLAAWSSFRMETNSAAAGLFAQYDKSFDAADGFGRTWLPLTDGTLNGVALTANGSLPATHDPAPVSVPWAGMREIGLPWHQMASFFSWPSYRRWDGTWVQRSYPHEALYDDTGAIKLQLSPEDVNDLVQFFLLLSGDWLDPAQNGGSPSNKLGRWQRWTASHPASTFVTQRPATFPLTPGLARVAAMRRLIDTAAFVAAQPGQQLGDMFRTRLYGYDGVQRWPANPNGDPCVGGWLLRAAGFVPDGVTVAGRGFQPRYMGIGGSRVTLLTLLPKASTFPGGVAPPVQSYYWSCPANRALDPNDPTYATMMPAFAQNQLVTTHFSDYASHGGTTGPVQRVYQ